MRAFAVAMMPSGGFEHARQFFERNIALPFEFVGIARDWKRAIAIGANRNARRNRETDIAVHVGINRILAGAGDVARGLDEVVPILGFAEQRKTEIESAGFERRPPESVGAAALFWRVAKHDRSMSRDNHIEIHVGFAAHVDRFMADFGGEQLSIRVIEQADWLASNDSM